MSFIPCSGGLMPCSWGACRPSTQVATDSGSSPLLCPSLLAQASLRPEAVADAALCHSGTTRNLWVLPSCGLPFAGGVSAPQPLLCPFRKVRAPLAQRGSDRHTTEAGRATRPWAQWKAERARAQRPVGREVVLTRGTAEGRSIFTGQGIPSSLARNVAIIICWTLSPPLAFGS